MVRRLFTSALAILVLAGCASLSQSPSTEPSRPAQSPLSPDELASSPPLAIQRAMADLGAEFLSLTEQEVASVSVSAVAARATALGSGGFHYSLSDNVERVAPWTEVGFVYLGRWRPPLASLGHAPTPEPTAVYLVQVLAEPVPQFPNGNTALVVINASTGELETTFSPCVGPTCSLGN